MKKTVLLFSFILFSCEGPEGPVGPQGPEGLQGPPGVADIEVVDFTFTFGQMTLNTVLAPVVYRYNYRRNIPQITQDIINDGVVIAYIKFGDIWRPLPFGGILDVDNDLILDFSFGYTYFYSVGELGISIEYSTSGAEFNSTELFTIRVVIIPNETSLALYKNQPLN